MDKERFAVALMTCNGAYDNCNTVKIYVRYKLRYMYQRQHYANIILTCKWINSEEDWLAIESSSMKKTCVTVRH